MGGSATVKVADSERTVWEQYLEKFEVDWVGSQWNKKTTSTSPPDSFDEDVQNRWHVKSCARA